MLMAMGQNVKTYPTTKFKFLIILKMEIPTGRKILNSSKSFSSMVYCHTCPSGEANIIARLFIALKKHDKN